MRRKVRAVPPRPILSARAMSCRKKPTRKEIPYSMTLVVSKRFSTWRSDGDLKWFYHTPTITRTAVAKISASFWPSKSYVQQTIS